MYYHRDSLFRIISPVISGNCLLLQLDTQVTYFRFSHFEQVSVSGLVRFYSMKLNILWRNRWFPEITGEIIQKSEAPAVGHNSRHGLDLYSGIYIYVYWSMISEWRRQSKSAGLWQYQTFRHGSYIYWTVSCALCARIFLFFSFLFFAYYGLFGGATCGVSVWNGRLTESTASVHYLHRVLD